MRVHGGVRPPLITADEAAALIPDGATLAIEASGGGLLEPTALLKALAERFSRDGHPRGITIMHASGLGDEAGLGADLLTAEGLLGRAIIGHYGRSPAVSRLAEANKIQAYCLPQGVLAQLFREIAAGRPGLITHIGLGTFIDPRMSGGRVNEAARDSIVELITLGGREWLLYKSLPIDAAFLRGTVVDELGNLTLDEEAARLSPVSTAAAARNSGGVVVAQAKRLVPAHTLPARSVVVPGHLVDYIVLDPDQWQTALQPYNASYSGERRVELDGSSAASLPVERRVVGFRALAELRPGFVVNLGVGMPDAVAALAAASGRLEEMTLTVEQGLSGGMPALGMEFGAVWNPDAMVDQNLQFDFYDGGGLDCTCLGFAEIDAAGRVNASQVAGRVFGVGGFVNISQGAKRVLFCGSFTSGGLRISLRDGRLVIDSEGRHHKFPREVGQISFNAEQALARGQVVKYITERAVFELGEGGLTLVEVAPGIDPEKDVLGLMDFTPQVRSPLAAMPLPPA